MKKVILISGVILLVVNILLGLIISAYALLNVGINCGVIALTTALIYSLNIVRLKDAFVVSFTILFSLLGFAEFLMGLFAGDKLENNWWLILVIISTAFELIVLLIATKVSKIK